LITQAQYDAYIAGQQALGRDTSEYRPDIREKWAALAAAARAHAQGDISWTAALHIAADHGFTAGQLADYVSRAKLRDSQQGVPAHRAGRTHFGGHFEAQRMPWYERLLARLRGWDA
jgi:hypothetical protein